MAYRERQKISQMTPKGANLAATDLIEVSELVSGTYQTKSITGQEIIDAASGGALDLQAVTDNGNNTTNDILIQGTGDYVGQLSSQAITTYDSVTGAYAEMFVGTSGQLSLSDGSSAGILSVNNLVNNNVQLEFPNKTTGTYTIATTSDLTSGTVTSVATTGLISGGPITTSGTITTSMNTNKLVGRSSAGVGIMQEITVGTGLTLTGAGVLNNTATPTATGYYGAWQDVTTQTAVSNNVGYPMKFATIDYENQVRIVSDGTNLTRITFDNTGVYNLNFSVQLQNVDNAEHDVTIWLRKNGTDVTGSAGYVTVPKRRSTGAGLEGHSIAGWNYLLSVVGGDYYQIIWSTTSAANVTLQFYAAGNPPPSTASTLAIVTQQSGIMGGTGLTALNTLTGAVQTLAVGQTGSIINWSSSGTTHTLNVPIKYTIELIDALTTDFYAPYNLSIGSVTNILNSPTITIQDNGVAYTLGNTIASGSRVTITANTASVVTLNVTRL